MKIKGLAEKIDPNIKRSKLIREEGIKKGVPIPPVVASLAAWPMNLIPPIVPLMIGQVPGPPITPLGLMYWALAKPDKIEKRALQEAQAGQDPTSSDEALPPVSADECNPEGSE